MFHATTTFNSSYTDATLDLDVEIANESENIADDLSLHIRLIDAEGKDVKLKQPLQTVKNIKPGSTEKIALSFEVLNPQKCDSERPYLYTLNCELHVSGKVTNASKRRVGFRQVEVII